MSDNMTGETGIDSVLENLETELTLEIGWYEAGSFGYNMRIFNNGHTMVLLLPSSSFYGEQPTRSTCEIRLERRYHQRA